MIWIVHGVEVRGWEVHVRFHLKLGGGATPLLMPSPSGSAGEDKEPKGDNGAEPK